MLLTKIPKILSVTLFSILLFVLCFLISTIIEPHVFQKFFSAKSLQEAENIKNSYYYDVTYYANMAIKDQCSAFYPMLSWLVRYIFNPQTFEQAVVGLKLVSCICFMIGTPLFFNLSQKVSNNNNIVFLLTLIYTISPMAIFKVIGYTEGLFSLLSLILIWLIINTSLNKKIVYIFTFLIVFIMSLTRPVTLQIVFSATISLIIITLIEKLQSDLVWKDFFKIINEKYKSIIYLSVIMIVASIIGYSIYGSICLQLRGDFFAPFSDQKLWGKALGFYPQIFVSLEFPLFEQMALYFPIIFLIGIIIFLYGFISRNQIELFIPKSNLIWWIPTLYPSILISIYIIVFLWQKIKNTNITVINFHDSYKTSPVVTSYPFWFCFSFVFSHILINLFTVDKIYSLARFTFSLPFFFMVLAYVLKDVKNKGVDNILKWFVLVETIALVEQWVRYGNNLWLG